MASQVVFIFRLFSDSELVYINSCQARELSIVCRTVLQTFNEAALVYVSSELDAEQTTGLMLEIKQLLFRFHEYKHVYTADINKLVALIEEYVA